MALPSMAGLLHCQPGCASTSLGWQPGASAAGPHGALAQSAGSLQGRRVPTAGPAWSPPAPPRPQIKDLNSGTFGFVQLALDRTTGRQVAIKFIERGDKVRGRGGAG